jgi:AcrR family transcriptional regulator
MVAKKFWLFMEFGMPLKTFLNLTQKRQKEIIDVCLEEFAFNDYNDASLNRIIKKSGVAKGSFYRYFKSKKDVYEYLIEYGKRLNINLFNQAFEKQVDKYKDILEAWVAFYLSAVKLDNKYPLFSYFGFKVSQERNNAILGDIVIRGKKLGIEMLRDKFRSQQKKGKIRDDMDTDLLIYILLQIQSGFLDYLSIKYSIDFKKNVKERKPLFTITDEKIGEELNKFAKVLREGIGR